MKTFGYIDYYRENLEIAHKVEDMVNTCSSSQKQKADIEKFFDENYNPRKMFEFFLACLGYWSEAESYDERNIYAVFGSRKICEKFEYIKDYTDDDEILRNAYGFTHSAHRYLQNELFKDILEYFKQKNDSLWMWWEESEFVYNNSRTELIPYATMKAERRW